MNLTEINRLKVAVASGVSVRMLAGNLRVSRITDEGTSSCVVFEDAHIAPGYDWLPLNCRNLDDFVIVTPIP